MSLVCGIVEDQVMFRRMLKSLLVERRQATVALELGTLEELRRAITEVSRLDLLLLDIRLPDGDALDFIPELSIRKIATPVLLLSSSGEDFIVHRVMRSFVQGYVHKDDEPDILIAAIDAVAGGGSYFSPRFEERRRALTNSTQSFVKMLSSREQELLKLLGAGYADVDVASLLGLSPGTVHAHRRNIMAKLNLHTAQELQAFALLHGFTTVRELRPQ